MFGFLDIFKPEELTAEEEKILKIAKECDVEIQFVPGPTIYGSVGPRGIIKLFKEAQRLEREK